MVRPLASAFLALLPLLSSAEVPLRVVTFNIEANRDIHGDVTESLNDPGTADYNAVRDILLRINADVVCLQEIANADVAGGTGGGTSSDVHSLATELGLPHVRIPTNSGVFDFTLRNAVLSRYPILDLEEIGSGAYLDSIGSVGTEGGTPKDVTRVIQAIVVDVPGAVQPATIVSVHAKARTGLGDRFRRAVEFARIGQYFANNNLDFTDNIIVLGDLNLSASPSTFTTEPSTGLPATWNRGTDIALPISYSTDPDFYFPSPYNLVALDPRDLNGNDDTFETGGTIDFILPSPVLIANGSEIYRSNLDTDNVTGLPKSGSPLNNIISTTASDHFAVFADLSLLDPGDVEEYVFTQTTETILENFDAITGLDDPTNWTSAPLGNWHGPDNGTASQAGKYAYGSGENALGILPEETSTFTAAYRNNTGAPIVGLQVSYDAEQWRVIPGGSSDDWSVELIINETPTLLGPLAFVADTSGATIPGTATPLNAVIGNLSIPDDTAFQLRFTATLGTDLGSPSSDVFLNELHYENDSNDTGEFLEIVVAPSFTGTASDVDVYFYNGSNGNTYSSGSVPLSDFTIGDLVNGYQFYSLFQSPIQNGAPDGLAIVDKRSNTLLHFLSYEGTFIGSEGPANGITSTDIGFDQPDSTVAGTGALGLTGSGSDSTDFAWSRFTGLPHSPGSLNSGQTLVAPTAPHQGIAIDNLSVTLLLDTDSDGDPDLTDPDDDDDSLPDTDEALLGTNPLLADSDNNGTDDGDEDADLDGQTNAAEILITLTNPLDPFSRLTTTIAPEPGNPDGAILSVASLPGRTYTAWRSNDLGNWVEVGSAPGTGSVLQLTVAGNPAFPTNTYRITATLD